MIFAYYLSMKVNTGLTKHTKIFFLVHLLYITQTVPQTCTSKWVFSIKTHICDVFCTVDLNGYIRTPKPILTRLFFHSRFFLANINATAQRVFMLLHLRNLSTIQIQGGITIYKVKYLLEISEYRQHPRNFTTVYL